MQYSWWRSFLVSQWWCSKLVPCDTVCNINSVFYRYVCWMFTAFTCFFDSSLYLSLLYDHLVTSQQLYLCTRWLKWYSLTTGIWVQFLHKTYMNLLVAEGRISGTAKSLATPRWRVCEYVYQMCVYCEDQGWAQIYLKSWSQTLAKCIPKSANFLCKAVSSDSKSSPKSCN